MAGKMEEQQVEAFEEVHAVVSQRISGHRSPTSGATEEDCLVFEHPDEGVPLSDDNVHDVVRLFADTDGGKKELIATSSEVSWKTIPLHPRSRPLAAIRYFDTEAFPWNEATLLLDPSKKLSVNVDGELDYGRVTNDDISRGIGERGISTLGFGRIRHYGDFLTMNSALTRAMESQLVDGTLELITALLRKWETETGLNPTEWSAGVSGIIQRVQARRDRIMSIDFDKDQKKTRGSRVFEYDCHGGY
ncbi:MAG: hypothetical protein AAB373_01610 [Patescibacteria group bacterium]